MGEDGRGMRTLAARAVTLCICAALAACGSRGPQDPNPQVYGLHDRVPEGGGRYKVGDPYQIGGQWFRPREDPSYNRTGVASWYGEYFHGRKTANGEWYDMNRMSAAHPTLPLPVYARVTNIQNGRSLVVRVNDRGPFKHDRIIDLSKGAATRLGMLNAGTAQVRVTYLANAPLSGDPPDMQAIGQRNSWGSPFWTASAGQGEGAGEAPIVTGAIDPAPAGGAGQSPRTILPSGFYVQAAAFANATRAETLAAELAHLGSFAVLPAEVAGDTYYRVRVGPVASLAEAEEVLGRLSGAGIADGRIVEE